MRDIAPFTNGDGGTVFIATEGWGGLSCVAESNSG